MSGTRILSIAAFVCAAGMWLVLFGLDVAGIQEHSLNDKLNSIWMLGLAIWLWVVGGKW